MKFKVNIIIDAEEDLFELYKYIYVNDSEGSAEQLIEKLYKNVYRFKNFPEEDIFHRN